MKTRVSKTVYSLLLITGAFLLVPVAQASAAMAPVYGAMLNNDVWGGWIGDSPAQEGHPDFTQLFNVVYNGSPDRTFTSTSGVTTTFPGVWGGRNRGVTSAPDIPPDYTDHLMLVNFAFPYGIPSATNDNRDVIISGLTPNATYDTSVWGWEFCIPSVPIMGWDLSAQGVLVADDFVTVCAPTHNDDNRIDFQTTADGSGVAVFTFSDPTDGTYTSPSYRFNGVRMTHVLTPGTIRTWNTDGSGDWSSFANWAGIPPIVANGNTVFGSAITSPQTVSTTSAVTVKSITFGDFDSSTIQQSYVVGTQESISLSSPTGTSIIQVMEGSHEFQAVVNLLNNTDVQVEAGASLVFTAALSMGGHTARKIGPGTMQINNASTTGSGELNAVAGTVSGTGHVSGNLNNTGATIAPGNSLGTLNVGGNYVQTAGGMGEDDGGLPTLIEIEIGSTGNDVLNVTGDLIINSGGLDVLLIEGFEPALGDTFDVLNFNSASGAFDDINLPLYDDVTMRINDINATQDQAVGWDTSQLLVDGTLRVVSAVLGDMDGDLAVTTADVSLFVLALVDRASYNASNFAVNADINGNVDGITEGVDGIIGTFDLGDLSAFSALLGGPASASAVPEPASSSLLIVALGALALRGRRRKMSK